MDWYYDGQIRRYITQFMRVFIGFKYRSGDDEFRTVPVMYGDLARQVATIIKENSENKLPSVPRIACYISGIEMDTSRLADASFVSKINIRERAYNTSDGGIEYENYQGAGYTVERLMPTPYTLSMKADIWTSNTDQKLQLLEQIAVLFNPSLEIQTTDNFVDWTSITVLNITGMNFSSRTIPQGAESEIDICTIDFSMPIYLSPPAKVKKLGIVRAIIANIFADNGSVVDLESLIYNNDNPSARVYVPNDYRVLLFKSNNQQSLDYDLVAASTSQIIKSFGLEREIKLGDPIDWNMILDKQGGYTGNSRIYFMQPTGYEITGTFAINPVDPSILVVSFDPDTLPPNTLLPSIVTGINPRGTIDAIVDPTTFNPIQKWNGLSNIPVGTRYLLLASIGDPENADGAEAWKGTDGSTQTSYRLVANDIVEWNGSQWISVFDSQNTDTVTYIQNLRTGIQYRWDGQQWLKSFEGEYAPGSWRFDLDA
jgi:hypothetical protein